jgi:hypothetical protein
MPKIQTDYSHTIIYKLCCKDVSINDIYVGHTTNFIQRKHNHKINCCNKKSNNHNLYVYKFIRENGGWDNWEMIQLEEYNCANRRESEMRERYWIETLMASLNCISPFTTKEEKQEQKKNWYEENKEHILEKAKEHYEENKEQKIEYQKQYSKENSEVICEKQKEYREKNKEKISEQKKIYREEHKEEIKEMMSKWREANKEKIKEKRCELINCECGNQYTIGNKVRHLQTKIHTDYQNKLCGIIVEPLPQISEEEKINILRQKQKEYREKNAEKLKEQKKIYNDTHKKENSEARKKYYDSNKNQIIEKEKIYVQENKDKVKERKDEWYQKNKEKILEKQKAVFICECGSEVRCGGKAEHLRSTKHKNYIENAQQNNNIQNTSLDA